MKVKGIEKLDTEAARQQLFEALQNSALESDLAGVMNQGPNDNLVRRWLPHGSFFDLYLIYCANQVSASEPVASSSTFYRALENSGWRKLLRFLPPSSHSKCTICSRLKSKIKHATDIEKHLQACDQLMRHLAGQFQDRACYYEFRHRAKTTGDILCLIVDSMDRGKFALPRYVGGRVPKDIADVKRPSAEVTTVLAHGHGVFTYLADENQTAGSNWTLECLNRTLEHIFVRAQKLGKAVPPILKLFSDNAPKATWSILMMVLQCFTPSQPPSLKSRK